MPTVHLTARKLSENLGIYAFGFLDAAVGLFARANDGRGLVDSTFYPAAYCFRHGVELFVKQASVYVAYELRDPALLYEQGHELEPAWKKIAELVASAADGHGEERELRHHLDVINTAIEEIQDVDARGCLFRYPEAVKKATSGKPRTRSDTHVPFDHVNLDDWQATAEATLAAAQSLLSELAERADYVRGRRGEPPLPLSDLASRAPDPSLPNGPAEEHG